jgi:hypothetical protein
MIGHALAARGRFSMKAIAKTLSVSRPDLDERLKPETTLLAAATAKPIMLGWLLPLFRELAGNQATCGYRRDWGRYRQDYTRLSIDCVERRIENFDRLPHHVEWISEVHNLLQHHELICFGFKQIRS